VGEQLVGVFKLHAGLKPTEDILDVGCGIGRVAIPLTQYVTSGSYNGFDIIKHGIEWCQTKITASYPRFRFFHANIYNKYYNPGGNIRASEYVFPFADRSFDFVFLTSVFTHMLPRDLEHYVAEISRVLRPGGRCLFTAFIISPEALEHLRTNASIRKFEAQPENYWTDNPANPEAAIGYTDTYLKDVTDASSLRLAKIVPGGWWSNPYAQDIIVVEKNI